MKRIREPVAITLTTMLLLACVAPRIETRSRVEGQIGPIYTVEILPANAMAAGRGNGDRPPGEDLSEQAATMLEDKGYLIATGEGSDVRMTVSARIDRVTRRTWSSDPDASALRDIEVDEAVIVVALFDEPSAEAVWTVEARSRLPQREAFLLPAHDEIWIATLREAIQAFPATPSRSD